MLPDKRDKICPPKIKFNSRDGSKEARTTCIPRLKSFPAEKIKKLDNLSTFLSEPIGVPMMQRDSREIFPVSSSVGINCDRGNATSSELLPSHQQFKPPRASATNQQQVAPNHQQTDQTSSQFEQIQQTRSLEKQARHSLVSNACQESVMHNQSSQNPSTTISQQVIIQHSPTQGTKRSFESSSCATIERNHDKHITLQHKEQPIGGRNAVNYRQAIMQMQQQTANNCQSVHLQDTSEASSRYLLESCQPIYQHNMYNQQMPQMLNPALLIPKQQQQKCNSSKTPCSYQNQRLSAMQLAPAQGMTSPQDMTINQMRLMRHNLSVHQQNFGYPVGHSTWPLGERWTGYNQQHSCHQQASPLQWGYDYQNTQNSSFSRQNPKDQDQRVPSQNQMSCKIASDQQAIKEVYGRQDDKKRTLQFTPDMVRDQELLISAMRQQGVSHDVMRRQFDALLNEQRRHLTYIAQFQQQTDTPEVKRTCRLVQRRTENNEKPEWMVHITPPRISYSDLERINSQQKALNELHLTNDQSTQEVGRAVPAQQQQQDYCPQQSRKETNSPTVSPQRMYLQMNYHQWQQQMADWSRRGDHQTPCGVIGCYPYSYQRSTPNSFYHQPSFNGFDQSQQTFYQLHSYQAHPEHQVWPEEHNASSPSPINKREVAMDVARKRSKRSIEPFSLLKMRVYKEVIRPQKCNNGLQNLDTVQKALEMLKDPTSKKGLEYLANLTRKKPAIRLNGTQEADEIPENLRLVSSENTSCAPKRVSANGLENKRNPDNPASRVSRPKRLNEPATMEDSRQRQNLKIFYDAAAEIDNGAAAGGSQQQDHAAMISHIQDAESISCNQANLAQARPANNGMILPYGGVPDYQQIQQCCHSGQSLASHNGGQGDGIASIPRPNVSDATGIDRAGGDAFGEISSTEVTTKCRGSEQSMSRTCSYGRPEIHEARTID